MFIKLQLYYNINTHDDIEQPNTAAINQFMSDLQSVSPVKLFDNF